MSTTICVCACNLGSLLADWLFSGHTASYPHAEKSSYPLDAEPTWQSEQRLVESWLGWTFQTENICLGGFKLHAHCYGLVCAKGKRSLRQAGGARGCKHCLMLFTLFHSNVHCAHSSQSHETWSQSTHHGFPRPFQSCRHKLTRWIMHSYTHNGSLVIPMACAGGCPLF